jgi:hypothetical protein
MSNLFNLFWIFWILVSLQPVLQRQLRKGIHVRERSRLDMVDVRYTFGS